MLLGQDIDFQKYLESNNVGIVYYHYDNINNIWHYLDLVQSTPINDLKDKNLVVCYSTEVGLNYNDSVVASINQLRKELNNRHLIFIINGIPKNQEIPDFYKKLIFSPNLHWFKEVANYNLPVDYSNCNQRPFLFDALFGGKKDYRIWVFKQMEHHGFLHKSLVFIKDDIYYKSSNFSDYESPELFDLELPEIQQFKLNWHHTVKQITVNQNGKNLTTSMSCFISPKIYQNSWFSILTESVHSNDKFNFITEKTAKCLFAKRVFVCFSSQGHLECLRNLGFKTFDGIIDESYDQKSDSRERLKMAFEQVLWLSKQDPIKIYQQAEEILEHNFKIMTKTDLKEQEMKNFIVSRIKTFIISHVPYVPHVPHVPHHEHSLPSHIQTQVPQRRYHRKDLFNRTNKINIRQTNS